MNVTIFSKDRACQLDTLINSIKYYWKGYEKVTFNVVYNYSTFKFKEGYNKCATLHKHFNFIDEKNYSSFKEAMLKNIRWNDDYIMFLVDDIIFKDYFSVDDKIFGEFSKNDNILTLSTRLGRNISFNYTNNKPLPKNPMNESNIWNWKDVIHDPYWGYIFSLDGNVYKLPFLLPFLVSKEYTNPNRLEEAFYDKPFTEEFSICYDKSILMNIPSNRVQSICNNKHMGSDVNKLNEMYLSGLKINFLKYKEYYNKSCHIELDYEFYNEKNIFN